jgi:hypothetical protein
MQLSGSGAIAPDPWRFRAINQDAGEKSEGRQPLIRVLATSRFGEAPITTMTTVTPTTARTTFTPDEYSHVFPT